MHERGEDLSKEKMITWRSGDPDLIPGSGNLLEKGQATHSSILGLPLWLSR